MCSVSITTGTGRAGTSFLIGLFTLLKLETGFTPDQVLKVLHNHEAHAGIERYPQLLLRRQSPFFQSCPIIQAREGDLEA